MTTRPGISAETWLAAAIGGGLPDPTKSRWQPMRVGIVNLWEYDDAEFWFADGRLVLRGGNGAGKTKVLELTTLMLLRGEIMPSVLDPFGSQHRTMRFNLLPTGEADDPRAPADSGLGYAWVEFGRLDTTGESMFFVCGMGASARRGSGTGGVATWHFVTARRPGKDFTLLTGGRALEQKDLSKLDGVWVPPTAAAYRARLANDLFGLTEDSYNNLTELLKQLRRPKLGERLNPASLVETLRDALPPLAAHEITQLAEGWEHLEQLRRAVEQTEEAATAVARFVRNGWRPWARVVLRHRADAFASATTTLDNTTRAKRTAETTLHEAQAAVHAAEAALDQAKQDKQDRDTELRELLESRPYQDALVASERAESLGRDVAGLREQLQAARTRHSSATTSVTGAREQAKAARSHVVEAERTVQRASDLLLDAAEPAGLMAPAHRDLPARDLDSLTAETELRADRFAELRRLRDEHAQAAQQAEVSAQAVKRAARSLQTATTDKAAATDAVEQSADTLRQEIRVWANSCAVAHCPDEQTEHWCDAVTELTVIDPEVGTVLPGKPVTELMRNHVTTVAGGLAQRQELERVRRTPLAERHEQATAKLVEARSHAEHPPPGPELWHRRHRPALEEEHGAPLWRCVNPAPGVNADQLALIEAALAASGLLDAWLFPTGTLAVADGRQLADTHLLVEAAGMPPARTLLAVLEPSPAGGLSQETVRHALGRIGWFDDPPADTADHAWFDWLAADGSWRLGDLTGHAQPSGPASFLGAAAREAARHRTISQLQDELRELDAQLVEVDAKLAQLTEARIALDAEERTIPTEVERTLGIAVATLAERARRRADSAHELDEEQQQHTSDLAHRDTLWARFAEYASEHRFGLHELEQQAEALRTFRSRLDQLSGELRVLAAHQNALATAEDVLADREQELAAAKAEASTIESRLRQAKVRLATAEAALGADHREQLRRRDELDLSINTLAEKIEQLGETLSTAEKATVRAEEVLKGHEQRRAEAEQARDEAMRALWAAVDIGLAEPVGLAIPDRRNVQAARELSAAARRQVTASVQAGEEDRAWRRCYRELETLRQQLLPNRDARVMDDEHDDHGVQQVTILADPTSGWQPPHQAADGLAARVREQQDHYDAEQQRVLTTLLGSTFIEHLKDRLDYTTHTFARINEQLARHPTRHGHAVRVAWQADPTDPDASAVVTALGQGYQQLSTERQDKLRSFLARKIDEARSSDPNGSAPSGATDWKERLTHALDYRSWLRLSLDYRPGAGTRWTAFDTARHAAKSGGEKVVLLSQPLFAAAVVAYDAAAPTAPRWVWLDEAMTGIDAAVKASFMGLTVDFELDVMLTAHDEWCNYSTVPAVAIYDLARERHLPGVDALPYLWSGGTITRVDVDRLGARPDPRQPPAEGLFADLDPDDA